MLAVAEGECVCATCPVDGAQLEGEYQ